MIAVKPQPQDMEDMRKTKTEHALAVIKAGLSAIPVVGGSLASLVGRCGVRSCLLTFLNYIDSKDLTLFFKGNEANHEIVIMTKPEAEETISFCEMLLKILYEFPAKIK